MKIRYKVNQTESFRRGINSTDAITYLEIDPAILPRDQRELISSHLLGTDVVYDPVRAIREYEPVAIGEHPPGDLVEAKDPRLDSLLLALSELRGQTRPAVTPNSCSRAASGYSKRPYC